MSKRYNFKTQKGILEHCADRGESVLAARDLWQNSLRRAADDHPRARN